MNFAISTDDHAFRLAFEACDFAPADFNHEAHLRLAYVYLARNDPDTSVRLMRAALLRFLDHHRVDPAKYHETLTRAWILAVHHFMNGTESCASAGELIARNPRMLDAKIMLTHYSAELLFSDAARRTFVQPDLDPIPEYTA